MSADAWIKILVHSHGGILLRQENEEILPSVTTQTDLEGIMLSEIGQTQTKRNCISRLYVEYEKSITYKKELRLVTRGRGWGRDMEERGQKCSLPVTR